ncbi:hypothetical protein LCGC14_3011550, partial [marine sediment metagenome]
GRGLVRKYFIYNSLIYNKLAFECAGRYVHGGASLVLVQHKTVYVVYEFG